MTIGGRLAAAGLFALALASCGGTTQEADCVTGWQEAEQTISVRAAIDDAPDEVVSVQGALVFRDLETRLCATLLAGGGCGEPSLRIASIGNPLRAVEGMTVEQTGPPVAWMESVSLEGVVEDGVLSVPLTCGSERVIEHFADKTGQRRYRDLYGSGGDADHLNFEAAPNPETAAARRDE